MLGVAGNSAHKFITFSLTRPVDHKFWNIYSEINLELGGDLLLEGGGKTEQIFAKAQPTKTLITETFSPEIYRWIADAAEKLSLFGERELHVEIENFIKHSELHCTH